MKFNALVIALFSISSLAMLSSCEKEVEVLVDSSKPQGTFTATKNGTFVDQNTKGSKGAASLGTDEQGTQFLKFGSDFSTTFATGTVTVYLSTSSTFVPDAGNGNPNLRLIGAVSVAGENFYKLTPAAADKFTHVILWCGSASIPFGFAPLQ